MKNGAHGIADGAAQIRAAGSFADNERLDAERDTIAHECAEILRVRQCVHGDKQSRAGTFLKDIAERNGRRNFSDGEDTLKHRIADQRFKEFLLGEINDDGFRARFKPRSEIVQPFLRQHNRSDGKMAFEQPPDDLHAFGHENALCLVCRRSAHGGVRLEFG